MYGGLGWGRTASEAHPTVWACASRGLSRTRTNRLHSCAFSETRARGGFSLSMLAELSSRIFLWSMQRITSNEELATHWLRHYASIGIRMSTHAHIVVHCTSGCHSHSCALATSLLHDHNVSHVRCVSEWSSSTKTSMVNDFIAHELPKNAWLLYADADVSALPASSLPGVLQLIRYAVPRQEFFHYPPDVVALARRSYALCSSMVDRIAPDMTVPRVQPWEEQRSSSLSQQFSVCAPLRQRLTPNGGWMKLTLLRSRIRGVPPAFVNTHVAVVNLTTRLLRVGGNGRRLCAYTGGFPHYMHSRQAYALLRDKLALYERLRRGVSLRVYRAHLRLVERVAGAERFTPEAAQLIRNISVPCSGCTSSDVSNCK